jgi:hypothetical protein
VSSPRGELQLRLLDNSVALDFLSVEVQFGPHDPAALKDSWAEANDLSQYMKYAYDTGAYRFFCRAVSITRLDVIVEPGTDSTVAACNHVWRELRVAYASLRPSLFSAETYESYGHSARSGRVGIKSQIWRTQVVIPALIGLASVLLGAGFGLAQSNVAPVIAAFPGVANGLAVVINALRGWKREEIVWTN